MGKEKIKIYSDGGSRGNPGPAACAFIVYKNDNEIFKDSEYLGITTNNMAEYSGVLFALKWFCKNINSPKLYSVEYFLDSELVVRQLTGLYKVKDPKIKKIFSAIKEVEKLIKTKIFYQHVYREKNKTADLLLNKKLDEQK